MPAKLRQAIPIVVESRLLDWRITSPAAGCALANGIRLTGSGGVRNRVDNPRRYDALDRLTPRDFRYAVSILAIQVSRLRIFGHDNFDLSSESISLLSFSCPHRSLNEAAGETLLVVYRCLISNNDISNGSTHTEPSFVTDCASFS